MSRDARAGRGGGFRDLAELEAADLAETVARARAGAPDAGLALFSALYDLALEGLGKGRRSLGPCTAADVLALLALRPPPKDGGLWWPVPAESVARDGSSAPSAPTRGAKGGRRPKAGPGSRAEAAARLRALARLAALAGAPAALLEFYAEAAAGIETSADPARALALRRPRGRPPAEGAFTQAALDFLTDAAFRRARRSGATRDDALEAAGAELGSTAGRGRSAESARRARRRLRNPSNS